MSYIIGVDIGGTNTDAVLIDSQSKIISFTKTRTSQDLTTGFKVALSSLLIDSKISPENVTSLILGTTWATNAILQQKDLYKVGVLRLAGQYPQAPTPCCNWPIELKNKVLCGYATVAGGFECDGAHILNINEREIKEHIINLLNQGVESFAVIGVFSPLNSTQEMAVAEFIKKVAGAKFPVTLSHNLSGVGFLERENSAILNAALKKVMKKGFVDLQSICHEVGIHCPIYLTQNNGSRISLSEALAYPILTISAGPTNSFVGASKLCDVQDAIVVDIGGTSTDIGLIKKGVLRKTLNSSNIGGVKLNLSMPDVVSLAIGGGSFIDQKSMQIGPKSVEQELTSRAISFGGDQLTLTDLALLLGVLKIPGADHQVNLSSESATQILRKAIETIEQNIAMLTPDYKSLPIVLVGGGAKLFSSILSDSRYITPKYSSVANAFGAALSGIAGVVDTIVSLGDEERVLNELKIQAIAKAEARGAIPQTIAITDVEIRPYHYVPNKMARVLITAYGPAIQK